MLFFKNRDFTDKKILFIHIPKSAGQSILHMIRFDIFRDINPKWLYVGNPTEANNFSSTSGKDLADHNFLGGHVSLEIFKRKLGDNFSSFFSFSILRNPTDRAISLYSYILSNTDHYQHTEVKGLSLIDYIYSDIYPRNHQCHLFLQNSSATEAIEYMENNLDALGFYENLECFPALLGNKFGVITNALPFVNVAPIRLDSFNRGDIEKAVLTIDSEDNIVYEYFRKFRSSNVD